MKPVQPGDEVQVQSLGRCSWWSVLRVTPDHVLVKVSYPQGNLERRIGIGPPEWVVRHGDKLSFEEACIHFPSGQLKREHYRA